MHSFAFGLILQRARSETHPLNGRCTMRTLWFLGCLACAVASMVQNALFAAGLGASRDLFGIAVNTGYVWVGVALASDAVKSASPVIFMRARADREWGRMLACAVIMTCAVAFSFGATVRAADQDRMTIERPVMAELGVRIRAQQSFAEAARDLLEIHLEPGETPAALRAAIDARLADKRLRGCSDLNTKARREACPEVNTLRVKLQQAEERVQIEAKREAARAIMDRPPLMMAEAKYRLPHLPDPYASAIPVYGPPVLIELVSFLGFFALGPRKRKPAPTPTPTPTEAAPPTPQPVRPEYVAPEEPPLVQLAPAPSATLKRTAKPRKATSSTAGDDNKVVALVRRALADGAPLPVKGARVLDQKLWLSQRAIADVLGVSPAKVNTMIKSAAEAGLLTVTQTRTGTGLGLPSAQPRRAARTA